MSNLGLHFKVKLLVNVKLLENGTDRAILRWRTNSKSYTFSRKYEWVTLVNRGVCRISARSGDVPLASRGLGCGGGDWAPPRKVIFCLQNDKFWCILLQFLTGRKHRRLGTRILQFNREITNSAKIIQKFTVRPGAVAPLPHPWTRHCWWIGPKCRYLPCDRSIRAACAVVLCLSRSCIVSERLKVNYGYSCFEMQTGNSTKAFEWYHFQWVWMTHNPDFKVTPLFDAERLINGTRYRHSCNGILIGTYTCPTQCCHLE